MTQSHQKIWQVVSLIPSGNVASYGQIADLAGLPGRARLVSKALRAAPQSMTLPWFRVLRSSGHIAFPPGSAHAAEQIKQLTEDGILVRNMRVCMKAYQWHPDIGTILIGLGF